LPLLARHSCPKCADVFEDCAMNPLLSTGGVAARIEKMLRSNLSSRRRGGVAQESLAHTTPSAPPMVAARLLLCVAATPPLLRRGVRATTPGSFM